MSVYVSVYILSIHLSVRLFIHSSFLLYVYLSVCLTVWNKHLLEKLLVPRRVKKLPAFYRNWRFITVFTTAWLSQSWNTLIESNPPSTFYFKFNLPIYAYVFQVFSFIQISPPQHCTSFCFSPFVLHVFPIFFSFWSNRYRLIKQCCDRWSHSSSLSIIMYWW